MSISYVIISGLLMGLASSLHCAGMCGAIAASILAAGNRNTAPHQHPFRTLLLMQAGRSMTYILAGMLVGGLGGLFDSLLLTAGFQPVMRVLAGGFVIYAGLAVIGIAPALARLDRYLPTTVFQTAMRPAFVGDPNAVKAPAGRRTPHRSQTQFRNGLGKFSIGAALGLTPCAMVYNALLTAMMAGSSTKAGLFMASFAIAALPAVIFAALGINFLRGRANQNQLTSIARTAIAVGLVSIGLFTMVEPASSLIALCLTF
ncbi:sulfite exporter TauE/SafE family protein [Thalassospira lucentensis]|uniref:sulfite exporter TauE/SafE family protein n=1 Tax=Thalassospira lucentensis TaxID=168935 RepID=UPI003D2EE453